jgi:hypothetical protein
LAARPQCRLGMGKSLTFVRRTSASC